MSEPSAEQDQDQDDLARALSKAAHWLNVLADGGPDLRVNAHVKAAHEAAELAAEPSLEEFADVLICLVGTALHHGWTVADVADAVTLKTAYNTLRTWDQQPDGTWQHRTYSPEPERDGVVTAETGALRPDEEPCLCDTDFTCLARHELLSPPASTDGIVR